MYDRQYNKDIKDHELREMINDLVKVARKYANTQQLRACVQNVVMSVVKPLTDPKQRAAEMSRHCITDVLLDVDDVLLETTKITSSTQRTLEQRIEDLAGSSNAAEHSATSMLLLALDQTADLDERLSLVRNFRKATRKDAINAALSARLK